MKSYYFRGDLGVPSCLHSMAMSSSTRYEQYGRCFCRNGDSIGHWGGYFLLLVPFSMLPELIVSFYVLLVCFISLT